MRTHATQACAVRQVDSSCHRLYRVTDVRWRDASRTIMISSVTSPSSFMARNDFAHSIYPPNRDAVRKCDEFFLIMLRQCEIQHWRSKTGSPTQNATFRDIPSSLWTQNLKFRKFLLCVCSWMQVPVFRKALLCVIRYTLSSKHAASIWDAEGSRKAILAL